MKKKNVHYFTTEKGKILQTTVGLTTTQRQKDGSSKRHPV